VIDDHHEESPLDPELQRRLAALPRAERVSPAFTDRVSGDLVRRGLVHRPATRVNAQWLAAAAVIFATGIGVGAVVVRSRLAPSERVQSTAPNVSTTVGVDVNVPPIGHSEVWF